jgi:hypothetical protein
MQRCDIRERGCELFEELVLKKNRDTFFRGKKVSLCIEMIV